MTAGIGSRRGQGIEYHLTSYRFGHISDILGGFNLATVLHFKIVSNYDLEALVFGLYILSNNLYLTG